MIADVNGEVTLIDDDRVFKASHLAMGSGSDNTSWRAMIALGDRYGPG